MARIPFFNNLKAPGLLIFGLIALIIFSIGMISLSAAPVNITSSSSQAKLGIFMLSYFENANAPSSGTSVTVNTQTSIPTSSGSYLIPRGTSVYIWTTQFASSITVPSGKMILDLWAGSTTPAPSLDGQASASTNGASGSVSLTTTQTSDLIYVVVSTSSTPSVSISGAGLSWNLRGSIVNGRTGAVWTFYSISPSTLSSATITATLDSKQKFVILAFAVSGVNTSAPFDPNLGTVAMSTGSYSQPSVSFTTNFANDFLIGALYLNNNPTVTPSLGFSTIAVSNFANQVTGVAESENSESAGVQIAAFSLSSSNSWAIIGDALVPSTVGSTLSVSAYTTASSGANSNTLFSSFNTNTLSPNGGQVATVFPVTSGVIPAQGYVKIILTAPSTSDIVIQWGAGKPTNVQIALTYG